MSWTRFKHVMLTVLIGLSLFLSFHLWTAGGQLRETSSSGGSSVTASLVDRTLTEVFAPTKIIWHRNSLDTLLEANTFQAKEWINEEFETMTFGEVNTPQRISLSDYLELLSSEDWLEFIFDAPIPFGLFEDAFEDLPTDYENRTFTRFYINTSDPSTLGFYDTQNEINYTVEETSFTEEILNALVFQSSNEFTAVEPVEVSNQIIYLPVDEIEVEYHDYLVERLPNSLYINQFFTDTSEVVDTRRTGNTTRFIALTTEIRINDSTNTLTYLRQRTDMGQMTIKERLISSFQELRQIENWTETVQYHSYFSETNEVTFQRYIQGYPIYSQQQMESTVLVTVVEGGRTNLRIPLRVVQTPLTLTGEGAKVLRSGSDLISELQATGIELDSIQNIRVGLTWVENDEDNRVVHYEPDWYIQSQNVWYEFGRFIQLQEEALNGL